MWTEPGPKASCERHWLFSQLLEKGEGGGKHTKPHVPVNTVARELSEFREVKRWRDGGHRTGASQRQRLISQSRQSARGLREKSHHVR